MYTVKQLSDIAGITRRTLHYYDQIGLLPPSKIAGNGYRLYSEQALLRLQQILFYRETGCSLMHIKNILDEPGFDIELALLEHKRQLLNRQAHLDKLLAAVEETLAHQKGNKKMSPNQLFDAFNEDEQEKYEQEAMQMYDPATVKASNARWKVYTKEEKQQIQDQGNAIYQDLIKVIPNGPASPEAQNCIERWRKHLAYFWTPDLDQLEGLAHLYNDDLRFKENFDNLDPRLAQFMLEAVKIYVSHQRIFVSD
ncbi:MAG: MerR family transcriptional regulator [Anaerolineaceae bacterium]|nr:MerR family transcriptional regulator [Anaerolineaceae bacterium]